MQEQKSDLTYQQRSVLELLVAHINSQQDAIKTLEEKARHNFTIINIIAGIVVAFNLDIVGTSGTQRMLSERPIVALICVAYLIVGFLSLRTLYVKNHATYPMEVTCKNIKEWSQCDLKDHYDVLTESYRLIYKRNSKLVDAKGVLIKVSHRLLTGVILMIVAEVAGILPLLAVSVGK